MDFHRYMGAGDFLEEVRKLRIFRRYIGRSLLDSLEQTRLLVPRQRLRFPDPVVRRLEAEQDQRDTAVSPLACEDDGPRWVAALELRDALNRWRVPSVYGPSDHPLDGPLPQFQQFLETAQDSETASDHSPVHGQIVEIYYSTWQLLLAAEIADAGAHVHFDVSDAALVEAVNDNRIPDANVMVWINGDAPRMIKSFVTHRAALDAIVWFAEERHRALADITRRDTGRFRLSADQSRDYHQRGEMLSSSAFERFPVTALDLVAAIRFLAERWSEWESEGRPLVAGAYREFIGRGVLLTRLASRWNFAALRDQVGRVGGRAAPILDVIWPDWIADEKERLQRTLMAALANDPSTQIHGDVGAFVDFLAQNSLEAFFWRMRSFESHAFQGNVAAVQGMRNDLQAMAFVVEHVAAALGGRGQQLHQKFRALWRDPDVLALLDRADVVALQRQPTLPHTWPAQKAALDDLREERSGDIVADLVLANRIRGSVHDMLPEDDQLTLESLFVGLLRAAFLTFCEVRRQQ